LAIKAAEVSTDALILKYDFNLNANDSSGNKRDGVLQGTASIVTDDDMGKVLDLGDNAFFILLFHPSYLLIVSYNHIIFCNVVVLLVILLYID
jgi:hypothetical protein